MSTQLQHRLYQALDALPLVDSHSHIQPLQASARSLWDILGYHYYTELAHACGMPSSVVLNPNMAENDRVRALIQYLPALENTTQYQWFIELAQTFFGFEDERLSTNNWEALAETVAQRTAQPDWSSKVLQTTGLGSVFLTNDFDDPLEGFDTSVFVPCLRCDEWVFKLNETHVRQRLVECTQNSLGNLYQLNLALGTVFEHFLRKGARACAVSLPPGFVALHIDDAQAERAWAHMLANTDTSDDRATLACWMVWTLAQHCAAHHLPFCLMIGAQRGVYRAGIPLGQDLFDSRVSLMQYAELFNAFPDVRFPVSLLASAGNQELAACAWIFPNVITNGHWWYSGIPTLIERDLAVRLECVPQTKQIAYYSDMFKLEFGLPKFRMYKRSLAKVLAERFVQDQGWSERRAFELGQTVLQNNALSVYGVDSNTVQHTHPLQALAG